MSFVIYADKFGEEFPYIDGYGRKVIIVHKLPNRINKKTGKRWLGYVVLEDGRLQARSYSHNGINSEAQPNSPNNVVGYWEENPEPKKIYSEVLDKIIAVPVQDLAEAKKLTKNFESTIFYVKCEDGFIIDSDKAFDPDTFGYDKNILKTVGIFTTKQDAEIWAEHLKGYIKSQIEKAK